MIFIAAILAIMLTGQLAQAWSCPPSSRRYIIYIDKTTAIDNINHYDVFGTENAFAYIEKLSDAGAASSARYIMQATASGKFAAVYDSVEQKVVNCKNILYGVHYYRGCRYYYETYPVELCKQARAIATVDVVGINAHVNVDKLSVTTEGHSTTTTNVDGSGTLIDAEIRQGNQIIDEQGGTTTAAADVKIGVTGDHASTSSSTTTTVNDNIFGSGASVSGGDSSHASSSRRHRYWG